MCICDESSCCRKYFPEWTRETSMTLFWVKVLIILILAAIIVIFPVMNDQIWEESKVTWETMCFIIGYGVVFGYLLVLYWPYQHRIAPMWLQSIIYLIWAVFTVAFFLNGWYFHWWHRSDIQTDAFDSWTIGHTLSGIALGFCLPWWQTLFMLCIWEVLEKYWTVGLGDGESDMNHIVDVIVAVVGWWLVILIFKKSRTDIPWISSRNSCGNEGKCCFQVTTHVQQSSQQSYDYGTHV